MKMNYEDMIKCTLAGITYPVNIDGIETAEQFITYCARVSNPSNQTNTDTADKLIRYLIKQHHWSPFEMCHMVIDIETTRDIGRQILRHRSFSFQEFSGRYAAYDTESFVYREARLQDNKNRQNSTEASFELNADWYHKQSDIAALVSKTYKWALDNNIAKEQARAVLPEGMVPTRMFMSGTLRSWIHYIQERNKPGVVQKEHVMVAAQCLKILTEHFPNVTKALEIE